jgi:hypothetical protein
VISINCAHYTKSVIKNLVSIINKYRNIYFFFMKVKVSLLHTKDDEIKMRLKASRLKFFKTTEYGTRHLKKEQFRFKQDVLYNLVVLGIVIV